MKIPDEWHNHSAFGEAQMVLGPLDIPLAEEIEDYCYDNEDQTNWLIFRWNNNAVTMIFEGSLVVALSYRLKVPNGSVMRHGVDFFITDPIPEVFFKSIEKNYYEDRLD